MNIKISEARALKRNVTKVKTIDEKYEKEEKVMEEPTLQSNVELERCNCTVIHEDVINRVRELMPEEENLYDLAELFKVFGDTTRIKILCALFESEMCVCDIAALLNMTQSAISHQLRALKQARLVKYRREGKIVFYSLDDDHVQSIFRMGLTHINEK